MVQVFSFCVSVYSLAFYLCCHCKWDYFLIYLSDNLLLMYWSDPSIKEYCEANQCNSECARLRTQFSQSMSTFLPENVLIGKEMNIGRAYV